METCHSNHHPLHRSSLLILFLLTMQTLISVALKSLIPTVASTTIVITYLVITVHQDQQLPASISSLIILTSHYVTLISNHYRHHHGTDSCATEFIWTPKLCISITIIKTTQTETTAADSTITIWFLSICTTAKTHPSQFIKLFLLFFPPFLLSSSSYSFHSSYGPLL